MHDNFNLILKIQVLNLGTLGSIQFNLTYDQQEKKLTIDLIKAKVIRIIAYLIHRVNI